ncbi:MAG: glycosyltransferase family 4 protein [Gammaproteobacteria bacterium]|nr:glycosyltransferase family 4 protein [Gammaproteobacteria bacterium]
MMTTNKLRIAVDARPLHHPNTGIGRYTHILIKKILSQGHEVIKCTSEGGSFFQLLDSQLRYMQAAQRAGADLFWSPRHHLPAWSKSLPTVVTIHDLVWHKAPETMPTTRKWTDRILMKSALMKADGIIAVSESTKSDILELVPAVKKRITVIPEAPTITREQLNPANPPDERQPYVLFVGTLEPRKNLTRIVSAFLSCNLQQYRLIIAGQPGWGDIEIPSADQVKWIRPNSDEHLANLYGNAEFILAPSLYEGFGLQIAEALAFGKAVITSRISSMPEVAGEAALYVDPLNTENIAQAISNLANNKDIRNTLEKAAQVQAKSFSWDTACHDTMQVFETAIAHHQQLKSHQ